MVKLNTIGASKEQLYLPHVEIASLLRTFYMFANNRRSIQKIILSYAVTPIDIKHF